MSMGARGTLGKTLTFAKTGKTAYAKKHFTPANPKTPGQVGVRMMVTFLTKIWSTLTDADKASWTHFAEMFGLSLYHAFLKENCRRWASDLLPIKNTTTEHDNFYFNPVSEHYYNGQYFDIYPYIDSYNNPTPWMAQVCVGFESDYTPNKNNTIGLLSPPYLESNNYTFNMQYIAPWTPTPYFKIRIAALDGLATPFVLSTQY